MRFWLNEIAILLIAGALAGCASTSAPYTLDPVKTSDSDRRPLAEMPAETEENHYWDRIDLAVFHQLEKPLDLGWAGRQIGRALGVASAKEADNVNALGEPPNSSWYTRRHFYDAMTPKELARGPNRAGGGPDQSGPWTVVSGKMTGATGGFVVEDARSERYLLKFDGREYPEASSSAEVISTKIFHAAGYFVPENYITYFDPARLRVSEEATVRTPGGSERPMTPADVAAILEGRVRGAEGRVRALASKYVEGRPLGPWHFRGRRDGDRNDRVEHEHRRELRGMRVISAWLNDADRRPANTLAVYTDEKYLKHYLIDFGSTLGANGGGTHRPLHGQAYMIDPRYIALGIATLGLAETRPWAYVDPAPRYPSVGYYRADVFRPEDWVMTYPNPAFEKMTLRDAFWGAKMVMSFSDEDLEAIVRAARMTNPEAEAYLLEVLKKRRDRTGRYWFSKVNPLDRFRVAGGRKTVAMASRTGGGAELEQRRALRFDDLAVTGRLEPAEGSRYTYVFYHGGERLAEARETLEASVPLALPGGEALGAYLNRAGAEEPAARVVRVAVRTRRSGGWVPGEAVSAYVLFPQDGRAAPRVVGVRRSE